MLQDEIMKLGDYFRGIEYYNDALIVKVNFPPRWQVYPSKDGNIKPAKSESNAGEYYYYGNMNKVSLDDIFGVIKETIEDVKPTESEKVLEVMNGDPSVVTFVDEDGKEEKKLSDFDDVEKVVEKKKITKRKSQTFGYFWNGQTIDF
jgi:hypothetical protein